MRASQSRTKGKMKLAQSTILAMIVAGGFSLSAYVMGQGHGPAVAPPSSGTNSVPANNPAQGPQNLNPPTQTNPAIAPGNTIAPVTTPTIGAISTATMSPGASPTATPTASPTIGVTAHL
jgi:hypothetical protein